MPSYLSLINWTQQGAANVKDSPARLDAAKQAIEAAGGRMIFFYMTMGEYDLATLIEAPNDERGQRAAVAGGAGLDPNEDDAGVHGGRVPRDRRQPALAARGRPRGVPAGGAAVPWRRATGRREGVAPRGGYPAVVASRGSNVPSSCEW